MSVMSPEMKLYTLAALYAPLVALLTATSPPYPTSVPAFRWAEKQVTQDWFPPSSVVPPNEAVGAVSVLRVSGLITYIQGGIIPTEQPRFQIECRHPYAETARQIAQVVKNFLGTIDLVTTDNFNSPPTTPQQFPNFVLNERGSMDFQLSPPVHVEILDVRLFNRTDL
jgi:hypothetical protein